MPAYSSLEPVAGEIDRGVGRGAALLLAAGLRMVAQDLGPGHHAQVEIEDGIKATLIISVPRPAGEDMP